MTSSAGRQEVEAMQADLEDLWRGIDEMLDSLGPEDWRRPHGPDWTFADLPYHLSYFDRELVASAIQRGPDVPAAEQKVWATFRELNEWNEKMFAQRPAGQTPQQAVEAMRATREAVRGVLTGLSDADLARPAFIPLCGCGWLTARDSVAACRGHTWNHHTELRLRLARAKPEPSPAAIHGALSFYNPFLPYISLDRQQAAKAQLTTVMEFTGPGGGAWTVSLRDGSLAVKEERAEKPDLVLTQAPETLVKMLVGIADPPTLLQGGELRVQGMENMAKYGSLFPGPGPDTVIPPMGRATP